MNKLNIYFQHYQSSGICTFNLAQNYLMGLFNGNMELTLYLMLPRGQDWHMLAVLYNVIEGTT